MTIETNPYAPDFTPVIQLPTNWLACRVCGEATDATTQHGRDTITSHGREFRSGSPTLAAREFETEMTRCSTCEERRELAVEANAEFPAGRGRLVSDVLANTAVERALAVASVAGQGLKLTSARRVRLAIRYLTPLGLAVTWETKFAPVAEADVKSDTAAALPWAYVPEEIRERARHAFADYLRALTERPQPIPAPLGGACYLCGVASVEALPSRASSVWTEARVSPSALGGTSSAQVRASVCRTCADAAEAVGSYGPSTIERLVLNSAGIARRLGIENVRLDPPAWGVMGLGPNLTPWAHIDLDHLRRQFDSGKVGR